jgi:hypothetical protein
LVVRIALGWQLGGEQRRERLGFWPFGLVKEPGRTGSHRAAYL